MSMGELKHVAIIMDGNGRWAERRGLPRVEGHRKGVEVIRDIVAKSSEEKLVSLTLYSFSTENWRRPLSEVQALLRLFEESIDRYGPELKEKGVKVIFIGRREGLPENLVSRMVQLEEETASNTSLRLNIALNYGGRDEILRAFQKWFAVYRGDFEFLREEVFSRFLDTSGQPDPDLVIRTGGEQRLSNFLLWQAAYAELWFTPTLWPDFTPEELEVAIGDFSKRKRKFGGIC